MAVGAYVAIEARDAANELTSASNLPFDSLSLMKVFRSDDKKVDHSAIV